MINLIKIIFLFFLFGRVVAFDKSDVDPESAGAKSIISLSGGNGFDILDNIFDKFTKHIFAVLALILIGVFIYIGYLFITSDGDEAKFKKAWKTFIYTIIGIVVIILSWGVVKLVISVGI